MSAMIPTMSRLLSNEMKNSNVATLYEFPFELIVIVTTYTPTIYKGKWSTKWDKDFTDDNGDVRDQVSNKEFMKFLNEYIEKKKFFKDLSGEPMRGHFTKLLTKVIFWPITAQSEYIFPTYVTKQCVQDAIDTWGPFPKMLERIWINLFNPSGLVHPAIFNFHGRRSRANIRALLKQKAGYTISYNDVGQGLLFSYRRSKSQKIQHLEFKVVVVRNRENVQIAKFQTIISTPHKNGNKEKKHNFDDLVRFVQYFQKHEPLEAIGYEVLGGHH